MQSNWYTVDEIDQIDTPALLVYKDRVKHNINSLLKSIDNPKRLRPHIKTNKSREATTLMLQAGIEKFKCATIAEAEMLADIDVKDILLAYQPTGPKIERLFGLIEKFPTTSFSCLIDNIKTASELSSFFSSNNKKIKVWMDLNVGMNRTGIPPFNGLSLLQQCLPLTGIEITGLHAYDGHIRDVDFNERKRKCDAAFEQVIELFNRIQSEYKRALPIIAGGTPSFSIHAKRKDIECSPGTFIYWDNGYANILKEQPFAYAAVIVTRVVSRPADDLICLDLGHKAIASENSLDNRIHFINAEGVTPVSHSEEHLVCKTEGKEFNVGDVLYGIPFHICPTVALYDFVHIVENKIVTDRWYNISRNRKITI